MYQAARNLAPEDRGVLLSGISAELRGDVEALLAQVDAHGRPLKVEWQRCKVHFYRNVLVHVTKRSQAEVSEAMKSVFVQHF